MYIRITKEFRFEMAHALLNHDGACKNIHGHSYQMSITLKGIPIPGNTNPKAGMVIDFSDLKKIVNNEIIQVFDHALLLNKATPEKQYKELQEQKLILVDFQPTCENLLIYIIKKLKSTLPKDVVLHHVLLRETSTSFAEWYADDNREINEQY